MEKKEKITPQHISPLFCQFIAEVATYLEQSTCFIYARDHLQLWPAQAKCLPPDRVTFSRGRQRMTGL